jgi:hypothetical protein
MPIQPDPLGGLVGTVVAYRSLSFTVPQTSGSEYDRKNKYRSAEGYHYI